MQVKRNDWQDRIRRARFGRLMLRQHMFRRMKDDEGVTLIELMAVVVILGIIAAVAIPVVTSAITQAKVNTTETNLGTLQQALERYAADHGQYPATLSALDSKGKHYGPYLATAFPEPDSWGNNIYYAPVTKSNQVIGYVVLSGNGSPVSFSSTNTNPQSPTGLIVASGGQGPGGHTIQTSPTVDSQGMPTTLDSGSTLDPNTLTYIDN